MAVELELLEQRVQQHIEDAQVSASTDGYFVTLEVISATFNDMSAVKRQQAVYVAFNDLIADGSLHAVNIQALTPEEAETK